MVCYIRCTYSVFNSFEAVNYRIAFINRALSLHTSLHNDRIFTADLDAYSYILSKYNALLPTGDLFEKR
jgi:hypothetical protein